MKQFLDRDNFNKLYGFAYCLAGDAQEAEDLLHTSLEKALRTGLKGVDNKNAYLRTIIRNLWYDELRKKEVRRNYEETTAKDETISLEEPDPTLWMLDEIQLERCWQTISDEHRELLYYWCVLGMSTSEISAELDVPRGTILSRIHRLKKQLQKDMGAA